MHWIVHTLTNITADGPGSKHTILRKITHSLDSVSQFRVAFMTTPTHFRASKHWGCSSANDELRPNSRHVRMDSISKSTQSPTGSVCKGTSLRKCRQEMQK